MTDFDMDQQLAYDFAMQEYNLFISGVAGVGKSFVMKKIINSLRENGKKVVVAAFTMHAALDLDENGKTIYKAFNAFEKGLAFDEMGLFRLSRSCAWDADVIIIDEISMCSKHLFDYICKAIRKISLEHGRKHIQLIVSGDFLQLPPISKKGEDIEFAFESAWWNINDFKTVSLETQHRQQNGEYFEHLCQIRKGLNINDNIDYLKRNANYLTYKEDAVTLCSYRDNVEKINNEIIGKIPGEAKHYWASVMNCPVDTPKRMSILNCLMLKIGTHVMTTYNDPEGRYYNGATGTIISMSDSGIEIEFADSTADNPHIETITPHRWVVEEQQDSVGYIEQLPVIPAYAITIHKAQGCTLDYVNVDPRCFADGQLYVALSRVKDISHLYITHEIHESDIKVSPKVLRFYEDCKINERSETDIQRGA